MKRKDIISLSKEQVDAGRAVQDLFGSKGWAVYQTFLREKVRKIKDRNDYLNIYDFRSDRKVIKVLEGIESELQDILNDAEGAQEIINKLDTQTSDFISLEEETE